VKDRGEQTSLPDVSTVDQSVETSDL